MSANIISKIKNNSQWVTEFVGVVAIVVLVLAFTSRNPRFLSAHNITNILEDISVLLILAIGMTFVLLVGSIDLSVGAVASCAAVIFVQALPVCGIASYPLTMLFGAAAGLISGLIFAKLKVPSFIATFGTMNVYRSLGMMIAGGASQQIAKAYYPLIGWYGIKIGAVLPLPIVAAAVVAAIALIAQSKTRFGKAIYAIGGNERAARTAGLRVTMLKTAVFTLSGLCASIAGIILASKMKSGIPTIGDPFTLMTIAAVALGGTSMSGGKGGIVKTIIGTTLIVLIRNGMNVIGISAFWQQTMFGFIILIAVFLTSDRRRSVIVK